MLSDTETGGRREGAILLALAIVTGTWFRFWGLGRPTLWLDEFVTNWITSAGSWGELWERSTSYAATPPLFFAVERVVRAIAGLNELAMRLPAATFDIAAMLVLFGLVRELAGVRAGGGAALLFAWNTTMVYHARMARPYSLAVLLATMSVWSFWRAVERPDRIGSWVMFVVTAAGLLYTQFVFAPLLLLPFGWSVFVGLRGGRAVLARTIAALAAIGLVCWPLQSQLARLWDDRELLAWGSAAAGADRVAQFFQPGAVLVAVSAGLLAALVGRVLGRDQFVGLENAAPEQGSRIKSLAILFAWFAVPMISMWLASAWLHPTLSETRYLVTAAPPCCAILAVLVSWVRPAFVRLLIVAAYLLATPQVAQIREIATQGHATLVTYDLRPALVKLDREVAATDLVLIRSGLVESTLLDRRWGDRKLHSYLGCPLAPFYLTRPMRFFAVPDHGSQRELATHLSGLIAETASNGGRVWVVSHDGYGAGQPAAESVDRLLRQAGWQLQQAEFLGGELVLVFVRLAATHSGPDGS